MAATSEAKRAVPASMPIEGYDRLSIKEVLPLLKTLNSRELKAVTAYEKAGKNRVTLLRAVRKIELAREAVAPKRAAKPRLQVVEAGETAKPPRSRAAKARAAEARQEIAAADHIQADDFETDDFTTDDFAADDFAADDIEAGHDVDEMDFLDSDFAPMELTDMDFAQVEFADGTVDTDDTGNADASTYVEYAEYAEYDDLEIAPPPPPKPVAAKATTRAKAKTTAKAKAEAKAVPAEKPRSRPSVKGATWEEEIRPELPRRLQEAAVAMEMEFETPSVARIGTDDTLHAVPEPIPTIAPAKAPKGKALTAVKSPRAPKALAGDAADKSPLVRRFESVALVMAAILAVLLGLAIGTVLARSGSTDASPTPTSVSSQASAVQPAS